MKLIHSIIFLTSVLFLVSCSDDEGNSSQSATDDWLIPPEEVRDGGPGKDGIPALLNPEMISADVVNYLNNDDLIVGFVYDGEARAYPHNILDWHEIINDEVGGKNIAITYCPLTGTAIGWDREINGSISNFGVSGLLYNTNLMPYDRATDSRWTQIGLNCVNGKLIGEQIKTYQLIETQWSTWKSMFPETLITSTNTGHSRNYDRYPYGSYQTNDSFFFPVSPIDDRLHPKERVHGIIVDDKVKVYRFEHFTMNSLIEDQFNGHEIVVAGSLEKNFIVSFEKIILNGELVNFSAPKDGMATSIILVDQFDNEYDVFGKIIRGRDTGKSLIPTVSFIGYWFSWAPFYGEPKIYIP